MNTMPITTAYDSPSGKIIRVGDAVRGGRYDGIPGGVHERCKLYPRLSVKRQPSFSHMPGKSCRHSSGESPEHRQAKKTWAQYIRDQISGCPICVHDGRNASHIECPALTLVSGERMEPWTARSPGILWFCKKCGEPHLHDLYKGAVVVETEFYLSRECVRTRADIAILDESAQPIAIIEIRRKHLSDRPGQYAELTDIPLFVVDVSRGEAVQPELHNIKNKIREPWPDLTTQPPRHFDALSYRFGSSDGDLYFRARFDGKGELHYELKHSGKHDYHAPSPSIGPFLLAESSTLRCEDITQGIFEKVFPGESFDEEAYLEGDDWDGNVILTHS